MILSSSLVWLSLSALGVGALIGAVGVGGVLLIPALVYLAGLGVHQAMATALCSFIATGVVGTISFQRRGSIDWRITIPVCVGAVLFAFLGAWANSLLDGQRLSIILALVIVFAGVYTLRSLRGMVSPVFSDKPQLQLVTLLAVGAFVGFGAGLTGAGGPVLSVPVMIMLGFPPLATIGAGQVVQILAAVSGTLGNLKYGAINFEIIGVIIAFEVIGVVIGAKIVHVVDQLTVRRFVAWLCVVIGVWMVVKAIG